MRLSLILLPTTYGCGVVRSHRHTAISVTAPRQLARLYLLSRPTAYFHVSVLHCSTTCHPWQYALLYLPTSMWVVCNKEPATYMDVGSADIAGANICRSILGLIKPPSLAPCDIPPIPGPRHTAIPGHKKGLKFRPLLKTLR